MSGQAVAPLGNAPLGNAPAGHTPAGRLLPVLPPPRSTDRRITFAGLAIAVAFLVAAAASLLLPAQIRLGTWLPLHLALAGGAATAIASVMPFFTTALAVARPVRPAIRVGGIAGVAVGAIAVLTAHAHAHGNALAAGGSGGIYLAGLGLAGYAALRPLRGALGTRRRHIEWAYAVALIDVALGATLAILFVAGSPEVSAAWALTKPAHAWLNVFGFVSLTVAATLVHLAPTTAGARIRPRISAFIGLVALAAAAPLVAIGHLVASDAIARIGGVTATLAGLAIAAHGVAIYRSRGNWTREIAWHRMGALSLLAAALWFAVAVGSAGLRVADLGAVPGSWSLSAILAPLVVGFIVQALIGSWTHLVPAIGPGGPEAHARQRAILATASSARLIALNLGCAVLWLGMPGAPGVPGLAGSETAIQVGAGICLLSVAASITLFARASLQGRRATTGATAG